MASKELQEIFFQLVRLGIGTSKDAKISKGVDWNCIKKIADEQGLPAVVLDGLNEARSKKADVSSECFPSQQFTLQWIGEVMQNYEQRYVQYKKAIGSLAGWYNQHGFKMMVLKGYACSLDWPKPEHRPCGDIDIWLFGDYKAADRAVASEKNIKVDTSHHHHTVFEWGEFAIENHYDFINVHHHRSHIKLEKIFKELSRDGSHFLDVCGERVYIPSPDLQALFLLKHAALHFVGTELTFRQILDWAFFIQNHGKEVDWKTLLPIIEEHGMTPFLNIINAICVGNVGFDASLFPTVQYEPSVKARVVNEIFASVYDGDKDPDIFSRNIKRFRRWKTNAWKHKLCYKESMWSAFWNGVWGHLLKPSTL